MSTTRTYPGLHPAPSTRHLIWAIALFVLSLVGAAITGVAMVYLADQIGVSRSALVPFGVLLGGAVASAAVLRAGLMHRGQWGWRELGFVRPAHSLWHLVWWIPLTIISGAVCASILGPRLGMEATEPSIPGAFALGVPAGIAVALCIVVLVPLFEEIVFRRVLLDWLATRMPLWLAAVVLTLAFTAVHVVPETMLYIIFLSISLTYARLWFSSLWATLAIHAANNAVVAGLALMALSSG
ncbi:lysostaphin resistance A-like protein [Corynebacterium sp. LK2510]|uniref:lysostaphin resistance A-like protein n=1 Tax=Corynebacterium sp. LK2510 TaxID=3110472 RepID=UPI0034CD5472